MRKTLSFVLAALLATQNAWALKVNGQLENAVLEKKASAPAGVEGQIYYNTATKKAQIHNGTAFADVGSGGGGGGINYVSANADAEVDTSGYSTYADAAGASPVDGTGGSPSITWTRSTSSPLRGTASFVLTKGASNLQGQGVSYAFTMDRADAINPQMQKVSFDYSATTNFHFGSNQVTDISDVTVYIYDVTAGALIQPSTFIIDGSGHFSTEFQPTYNSTSYRLILHVSTTNASAWDLKVDNFSVGPGTKTRGVPVTDWQSWTPTFNGLGTVTGVAFKWRQVGDSIQIKGAATTGTPTASTASFTLPNSLSNNHATTFKVGSYGRVNANAEQHAMITQAADKTKLYFSIQTGSVADLFTANGNALFAPSEYFTIDITDMPILGWSSNTALSADAGDSRVIAARYTAPNQTITNNAADAVIKYLTLGYDTNNSYSTSTGAYTCGFAQKVKVKVNTKQTSTSWAANDDATLTVYKNGSSYEVINYRKIEGSVTVALQLNGVSEVDCIAGDTIDARIAVSRSSGNTTLASGSIAFERVSGPQTIAASETVASRYTRTTADTYTGGAEKITDYNVKVYDTHGAVTTGAAWKFTAPITGYYRVTASTGWAGNVWSTTTSHSIRLFKNGSIYSYMGHKTYGIDNASTTYETVSGSGTVYLKAGEYIQVKSYQDDAGSLDSTATDTTNYIEVTRVGN